MIVPPALVTLPAMKRRHSVSRDNWIAAITLFLLAFLGLFLWFQDPAHRPSGESRVNWPVSASAKP